MSRPSLVIFSIPKPFTDPHISLIQTNAILSWLKIVPAHQVYLFGSDKTVAAFAKKHNLNFRKIKVNLRNTPYLNDAFEQVQKDSSAHRLLYTNSDIIFSPNVVFLKELKIEGKFLVCGERYDLEIDEPIAINNAKEYRQKFDLLFSRSRKHPRLGSDYFLFQNHTLELPEKFLVGRIGWDNWLLAYAIRNGFTTIDASPYLKALHQNHDYQHLSQPKQIDRDPESIDNLNLISPADQKTTLEDLRLYLNSSGVIQSKGFSRQLLEMIGTKLFALLFIVVILVRLIQAIPGMKVVIQDVAQVVFNSRLDYDHKMLIARGPDYIPLKHLRDTTETAAKIIYPGNLQGELNQILAAYYVYPQRLLTYKDSNELDEFLRLAQTDKANSYYLFFYRQMPEQIKQADLVVVFDSTLEENNLVYRDVTINSNDPRFTNNVGWIKL